MTEASEPISDAWREYHAGELDQSEAICLRLLDQGQAACADALFLLGLIDHQRGRPQQVVEHLLRLVKLRPDYAEAHNNLGNALARLGRLREAEASFREALRHKPNYAEAHNNLGNALRDQRRFDESAASLRRALESRPGYAEAHNKAKPPAREKNYSSRHTPCAVTLSVP